MKDVSVHVDCCAAGRVCWWHISENIFSNVIKRMFLWMVRSKRKVCLISCRSIIWTSMSPINGLKKTKGKRRAFFRVCWMRCRLWSMRDQTMVQCRGRCGRICSPTLLWVGRGCAYWSWVTLCSMSLTIGLHCGPETRRVAEKRWRHLGLFIRSWLFSIYWWSSCVPTIVFIFFWLVSIVCTIKWPNGCCTHRCVF